MRCLPHAASRPVQEVTSRRLQRTDTSRSKSLAPGSPPSRPLRAASGGGLRPALTAAATRRSGQSSGRKNLTSASRSMPTTKEKACPDRSRLLTTTSPYKPGWSEANPGPYWLHRAPDCAALHPGYRGSPRAKTPSIRRRLPRPLCLGRLHPPRQIIGEPRERSLQRLAALAVGSPAPTASAQSARPRSCSISPPCPSRRACRATRWRRARRRGVRPNSWRWRRDAQNHSSRK